MADVIATRLVNVIAELAMFFVESYPVLRFLVLLVCLLYGAFYIRENNRAMAQVNQELRLLRLRDCVEYNMKDYKCAEFSNLMEVR